MTKKAPFKLIGGKFYLTPWIRSHIPPHKTYIELFGGAGTLLLNLAPCQVEVFNDLNHDITNFYTICRERPADVEQRYQQLGPLNSALFGKWSREWAMGIRPEDKVEQAARFLWLRRGSFSGKMDGYTTTTGITNFSRVHDIEYAHERFHNVYIENLDYERCIERHVNNPKPVVIYADPPYYGVKYYSYSFEKADHERLAKVLNKVDAMVVLSYNNHPALDRLYPGWHKICRQHLKRASTTRIGEHRSQVVEVLYCNFTPTRQIDMFEVEMQLKEQIQLL